MKRLSNLLAALVFASLVIFMSCGGGGSDPAPTPSELAAADLVGSWTVNASSITYDNGNPDGTWTNFALSFTGSASGGSFTTTGTPTEGDFSAVWPASGTWSFITAGGTADGAIQGIDRGDVEMDVNVSETSLTLSFTVPDQGARTSGIAGEWTFTFSSSIRDFIIK